MLSIPHGKSWESLPVPGCRLRPGGPGSLELQASPRPLRSPRSICMPSRRTRTVLSITVLVMLAGAGRSTAEIPAWLPRYDLDIHINVAGHNIHVRERVTWHNRHARPTDEV